MSIGYPSNSAITTTATSSVVGASTSAVPISAANPLRLNGGEIVNNSNKDMWLRFDLPATVTTTPPSIKIVANGGSIDIPENYIGPISGLWLAGATGNCTVVELFAN